MVADVAIVLIGEITKLKTEEQSKGLQFICADGTELISPGVKNPIIADTTTILLFNEVSISSDIYIFGYPTSLGIETSIQFDLNKPLIRKGIIANTYTPMKSIILDCPVYGGNSGGPVIQVAFDGDKRGLKLIGVVSQFIPYVQKWKNERDKITHLEYLNSGFSVACAIDHVLELIE